VQTFTCNLNKERRVLREIAQIILAIQLSTHNIPSVRAEHLAGVIQQQSDKIGIDGLIEVAIITHESQWNERAISPDGLDMGLMQIRSIHYGGNNSYLLDGDANIKVGSYLIKRSMDYCRKRLDREPTTQEWLSTYQGSGDAGFHCKPTKLTKLFENYYLCLKGDVENPANMVDCKKIYWPNR
jgi:hypothetical protein